MKTNLQKAIDFLWEHRESYRDQIRNGEEPDFDAPKYCGLSEEIHRQLDNYEVDAIRNLWNQLLGRDTKTGCIVIQFKNKKDYYSAVRKYIKEQEKNRHEDVILGDFLAWARKNGWWLRGFESIHKSFVFNKDGTKKDGWSFQWATQCGFVTDEDIRKVIPKKTASQWDCWGR
jgi:hypothetical protein